jgi:hypothetical protein
MALENSTWYVLSLLVMSIDILVDQWMHGVGMPKKLFLCIHHLFRGNVRHAARPVDLPSGNLCSFALNLDILSNLYSSGLRPTMNTLRELDVHTVECTSPVAIS